MSCEDHIFAQGKGPGQALRRSKCLHTKGRPSSDGLGHLSGKFKHYLFTIQMSNYSWPILSHKLSTLAKTQSSASPFRKRKQKHVADKEHSTVKESKIQIPQPSEGM